MLFILRVCNDHLLDVILKRKEWQHLQDVLDRFNAVGLLTALLGVCMDGPMPIVHQKGPINVCVSLVYCCSRIP